MIRSAENPEKLELRLNDIEHIQWLKRKRRTAETENHTKADTAT